MLFFVRTQLMQPPAASKRAADAAPPGEPPSKAAAPPGGAGAPANGASDAPPNAAPARAPEPVLLSSTDKAPGLSVSPDGFGAESRGGYRSARATHGATSGAWYCEVAVASLAEDAEPLLPPSAGGAAAAGSAAPPPTTPGAVRLGWAGAGADITAPVGTCGKGVGFRSVGGERVTGGKLTPFGGSPFTTGDVVGLYVSLKPLPLALPPPTTAGGDTAAAKEGGGGGAAAAGAAAAAAAPPPPASGEAAASEPTSHAVVAFFLNGAFQGVAFRGPSPASPLFPTLSLFTDLRRAPPPPRGALPLSQQPHLNSGTVAAAVAAAAAALAAEKAAEAAAWGTGKGMARVKFNPGPVFACPPKWPEGGDDLPLPKPVSELGLHPQPAAGADAAAATGGAAAASG